MADILVTLTDSAGLTDNERTTSTYYGTGTPAGINYANDDTAAVTLATAFTVDVPARIKKIRFYSAGTPGSGTHVGALFGTYSGGFPTELITKADFGTITQNAWNEVEIPEQDLVPGVYYSAAVYFPAGRYSYRSNEFTTSFDNGVILLPQSTVDHRNGQFSYATGLSTPGGEFNAGWYGVDVEVEYSTDPDVTATIGGATGLTRTVDDTVGLVDVVLPAVARAFTVSDVAGLTDALTTSLGFALLLTDDGGLSDALSRAIERALALQDSLGHSDAAEASLARSRAIDDAAGLSDALVTLLGLARDLNDPIGLTDEILSVFGTGATPTDSTGLTDALAVQMDRARALDDDRGLTDAVTVAVGRFVTITDASGLSDSRTATLGFPERDVDYAFTIADRAISATVGPRRWSFTVREQP